MLQCEEKIGDKGKLARASGNHVTIVNHLNGQKTRIRLPSGSKKNNFIELPWYDWNSSRWM